MRFPSPPLPIGLAPPRSPPQPGLPHPAPQRLGMHAESVFFPQMFGGQRRSEIAIAALHPFQHRLAKLFRMRSVGPLPAVAMLQAFRPSLPISRPDAFGLPIAQLQQLPSFSQPQAARLHSSHHFAPTQLLTAQLASPQSESLLAGGILNGDISIVVSRGHF